MMDRAGVTGGLIYFHFQNYYPGIIVDNNPIFDYYGVVFHFS